MALVVYEKSSTQFQITHRLKLNGAKRVSKGPVSDAIPRVAPWEDRPVESRLNVRLLRGMATLVSTIHHIKWMNFELLVWPLKTFKSIMPKWIYFQVSDKL